MMHIIESEEVAKTLTTLAPLTTLSRNDAHYTCYCGTCLSENYAVREGFRKQCVTIRNFLLCSTCVMQSCMEVPNPHKGFLHEIPGNGANPPLAPSPHPPGLGLLIKQFITFTASGLFCISHPPIPSLHVFTV